MEPVVCAAGVKRPPRSTGPLFEDGLLTLAGTGRAGLCADARAADRSYLKSGELVKIFAAAIDDGRDYYLCVRQDSEMTPTASSYRAGCVSRPLGDLHLKFT